MYMVWAWPFLYPLSTVVFILNAPTTFMYPSLVLVQPRKTRPCLIERLLMGQLKNQIKKTKQLLCFYGQWEKLKSLKSVWQQFMF